MIRRVEYWAGVAVGLLGIGAPALGQDSISNTNGLPGDGLSAYTVGASSTQVKNYVVDLTPKNSSWGRGYSIGPIAKSSLSLSTAYFNNLMGAQAASNRFTGIQSFLRTSYDSWSAAGQGINPARNGTPVDDGSGRFGVRNVSSLRGNSFGAAFMEFGGGTVGAFGDADDDNNIVALVAGFQTFAPSRVYVSRVVAAVNRVSTSATISGTSTLGLGGVDESGNVHLLADGFGLAGVSGALTQKQLWRVDSTLRSALFVNNLSSTGMGDPTPGVSRRTITTDVSQTTPTIIPRALSGRAIVLNADLANNFQYEAVAGAMTGTTGHLPPGVAARGPVAYTRGIFGPMSNGAGRAGTCGVLARGPSATKTRCLSFWVVNADGSPDGKGFFELPTANAGALVDPTDGFDAFNTWGSLGNHEFTNYGSQVCFRGGNGPVALAVLPDGQLLAAAVVAPTGGGAVTPQGMDQYLAVARIDLAGGAHWTIAAHTGTSAGAAGGLSKKILGDYGLDGIPGTFDPGEGDGFLDATDIGRLARAEEVFKNAATGPSISSPAMDRQGNLYFLATVSLRRPGQPKMTTALLRANRDEATDGYSLELLAEVGDVVAGQNSRRNYQIQHMGIADADSVDSGAVWSGNIVQDFNPSVDPASPAGHGAASLGALVLRARIVYDVNQDGQYIDPTTPGNAASPDQAYNAMMLLLPRKLLADVDQDGFITGQDFDLFVQAYFTGQANPATGLLIADVAASGGGEFPDGFITGEDFDRYVQAFFNGQ